MRIAHLIMAHKNPGQLERLIVTMKHTMFDLYIHLDKKTDIKSFRHLDKHDNVFFIMYRIECNWGGYSFVKAKVINDNLRHIDWSRGGAHPKIFSKHDLQDLVLTDKYFARKFDISVDEEILDLIDQNAHVSLNNNYIQ